MAALCLTGARDAAAQELGARALGRAGAGRADPHDVAALSANLAAVATEKRYDVYAHSALGPDGYLGLGAGAVDSRTSVVSLGGGYTRISDTAPPVDDELPGWKPPDDTLEDLTVRQGVHLGLAVPVMDRRLGVAVTGRYDWSASAISGEATGFNLGVGVAARPWEWLSVAAGARDVFTTDYAGHARSADLAVRWMPDDALGLEVDVVAPLDAKFDAGHMSFQGGADALLTKWLVLRAGGAWDGGVTAAAGGLGLLHDKAALDYGFRVPFANPKRSVHALDVRVLF